MVLAARLRKIEFTFTAQTMRLAHGAVRPRSVVVACIRPTKDICAAMVPPAYIVEPKAWDLAASTALTALTSIDPTNYIMTKRKSKAYRFTIDTQDSHGYDKIESLKYAVATSNMNCSNSKYPQRVVIRARLGKDSPFKYEYSAYGSRSARRGAYFGNYKLIHARRADVYVYDRR